MATKPRTNQYEVRRRETEGKLRQALERLKKRMPSNPKLQKGGYRLSVSTLAQESGVSRNAIYTNHREVLEDLRTAQRCSKTMQRTLATSDDKIAELRGLLRAMTGEHESEKRLLITENASLLLRAHRAEARLAEAKRKLDKLQGGLQKHAV